MGTQKDDLKSRLKRHEGLKLEPYRDSRGNWSIGFGHFMGPGKFVISRRVADAILDDDIHKATFEYLSLGWDLDPVRRDVVIEMIFWHGLRGFLKFKKTIAAIERKDWNTAADEMMDSNSGRNFHTRMSELADMMRTGEVKG
ncbi:MAG: lysozyme [Candidatus Nealsonbacteria bacterium]|nr:MAG: lysozyme [Candidatus Nealsonbacteria bacterium]